MENLCKRMICEASMARDGVCELFHMEQKVELCYIQYSCYTLPIF